MAGTLEFLAEGYREIGRKAGRAGLRRRLVAMDRERRDALIRMGRTAWRAKVGLADFADLRGHLEQLEARAGGLSATAARLDAERADLQTRRQAEVDRFDALLAPAKAAQAEADTALRTARAALAGQAAGETAARALASDDVNARIAEGRRCAAETARIDGERKAALQPIDAELERLKKDAAAATTENATVGRDLTGRFLELGTAIYDRRPIEPALAESARTVAAVDARRSATQAAIDESLGRTRAMPPGTMAKFLATAVLVCVVIAAVGYGVSSRPGSREFGSGSAPQSGATSAGTASTGSVAADERRKDEAVLGFPQARTDQTQRTAAVEILEADIRKLGSAADRSSVPLLLAILERGEPELRAAAANALGMIGPTTAEVPALIKALNDPLPVVRDGALSALEQAPDSAVRLLVGRARASGPASQSRDSGLTPTVAPDEARLGMRIYPGATFLAFASDMENGRVAFSSADPVQKVVDFYAAASGGRPPVGGEEFTRLYFGGSPDDPTGATAIIEDNQTWMARAIASGKPDAEFEAEANRRGALMMDLPLIRYAQASFYEDPVFVATEVTSSGGKTRVVRYAVVFQDQALGITGFALHVAAEAIRR